MGKRHEGPGAGRSALIFLVAVMFWGVASPASAKPLPLEYWALREAVRQVEVSPDGKHLALMKIASRDGDPIIEIYDTADLNKKPERLAAKPMEFMTLNWVSDDTLVISARQRLYKRIRGFNNGVFEVRLIGYQLNGKGFVQYGENFAIADLLPGEPDTILISESRTNAASMEDDPFAAFRPRTYHRLNLKTGQKLLVMKGSERIASAVFDNQGNPRFAQGYDPGKREFVFYGRKPGDDQWRDILRLDTYKYGEAFNFAAMGFEKGNPNIIYVLANNGHDKVGLWTLDVNDGKFGKLIYRRSDVDVAGVRTHSDFWNRGDEISGVTYYGERLLTEWFDPGEKALYAQLRKVIPNAYNLTITARSRGGSTMTIANSGPKDPGSYYLLKDGKLQFIGSQNPLLKPEHLSDVRYIKYKARDGRTVPAYLTVPKGKPPFPLIVLPHGGPYVAEIVGYDEWGQMLANNGYMVLQPQYRGSFGYGVDHFMAAMRQSGLKMQDDKDDGARYLVSQRLADPKRMAMFGWSYGGYAALVAASRTPQLYQCVIAGAAVADPELQLSYYKSQLIPAQEEFEEMRRQGIQPVDDAAKVNVPILLIHGDVDQRVPFRHFEAYEQALRRYGKTFKPVILKEADHFYNTLYYRHQIKLYTEMIDFLQKGCGPGGL